MTSVSYKMITSLYLSLATISLLSSSFVSGEWIDCGLPKSFEVELENHQRTLVYDAEIKVKYDRNELAVYEYSGISDINLLMNNTAISFSGHIVPNDEELDTNAFKTSRIFNSKIAGSAVLTKFGSGDNTLNNCNLYLSRNRDEEELNLSKKLQVEIIHQAATCVKASLCQRLGAITTEDFRRAKNHPFEFGQLSVLSKSGNVSQGHSNIFSSHNYRPKVTVDEIESLLRAYKDKTNDLHKGVIQSTINKIVDLAIAELAKILQEENQGKIKIPDLTQNFSTGSSWWTTTGEFNAYDGTFEDLTTLSRTEDAVLSHTGLKFVATCGFGLTKANMEYQKYKLRYGVVKVNGKLSASIDGISLTASVAVDYGHNPCRAYLDNLRVTKLGNVKVKLTGLGPLNKLTSRLVTWITKKWQDQIVVRIEQELRDQITKILEKFDCEKYRP